MIEHSYSGLFGTFMTNCEGARKQVRQQGVNLIITLTPFWVVQYFVEKSYEHMSVSTHTISFWTWVGMCNAAGRNFYNDLYDPKLYTG